MIKLLIINLLFIFNINGEFCEGFKYGYVDGYCYEVVNCPSPPVPACPYMRHYEKDTYKDGYNRGFLIGLKNASKK